MAAICVVDKSWYFNSSLRKYNTGSISVMGVVVVGVAQTRQWLWGIFILLNFIKFP